MITKELSARELEIARLIACEELSNKQLASRLNVSIATVRNHIYNINKKLRCKGRAGIGVWYVRSYEQYQRVNDLVSVLEENFKLARELKSRLTATYQQIG